MTRDNYRLNLKEALAWGLGLRKRFSVTGSSMEPLVRPNDQVLVRTTSSVCAGDVIVLEHPHTGEPILKTVATVTGGKVDVLGLASVSTDSRDFGAVNGASIIGKLTVIL